MERFIIMAGPCVIESYETLKEIACYMKSLSIELDFEYYFKASWDKANRTGADKYRGPGMHEGLEMLYSIKKECNVKIITDFHEPWQAGEVAKIADIIQIPAYLSRQTDMVRAAVETGIPVQIKKAQFMSPEDMIAVSRKATHYDTNTKLFLCERGVCFGYNRLIVDIPGLLCLKQIGHSVIFDATHSVQLPGTGILQSTSGNRNNVKTLALAATTAGIDGLFIETHPNPDLAMCDSACMLPLHEIKDLIIKSLKIREVLCSE